MNLFPLNSRWALPSGSIVRIIGFRPGEVRCAYDDAEKDPVIFDPEWFYRMSRRLDR